MSFSLFSKATLSIQMSPGPSFLPSPPLPRMLKFFYFPSSFFLFLFPFLLSPPRMLKFLYFHVSLPSSFPSLLSPPRMLKFLYFHVFLPSSLPFPECLNSYIFISSFLPSFLPENVYILFFLKNIFIVMI